MAIGDLVTDKYEMEYNGLLIGGDTAFSLAQVDGLIELPDLSTGDVAYASRHGMASGFDWMRGRTIRLTVEVYADTDEEMSARMDELTTAFAPAIGEQALVFQIPGIAGGNKAQVSAKVRRRSSPINREWYYRIPIVTIELFCSSPWIVSGGVEGVSSSVATIEVPSGGVEFDATFDLQFGAVGDAGAATITNSGSVDAYPVLTITGPVTNPTVINENTGEWWAYNGSLTSGETLTVCDMESRTVILNGSANRYYLMTNGSEFWHIEPGTTSIRYTADTVTSSTATVSLRSAWV